MDGEMSTISVEMGVMVMQLPLRHLYCCNRFPCSLSQTWVGSGLSSVVGSFRGLTKSLLTSPEKTLHNT